MDINDQRDFDEEAAVRAEVDAEGRAELEAERIERVHQRLTFTTDSAGIWLHLDGTPCRILIDSPRRKRHIRPLIDLLRQAADLGALHGICNRQAELADLLHQRHTPGHVTYSRAPDGTPTMFRDETDTALPVPEGITPFYVLGRLVRALADVFEIAGRLADEPQASPAPVPQASRDGLNNAGGAGVTDS
jgi:hypothetical protein